jgi:hypothetical protein
LRSRRAFWYITPAMDAATLDFPIPDDPAEIRRLIVGLNLQRDSALRAAEQVKQQLELERQQARQRQQEWELEGDGRAGIAGLCRHRQVCRLSAAVPFGEHLRAGRL